MVLEALKTYVISPGIDYFYFLSKATLAKDESKFDRYDIAFTEYSKYASDQVDLEASIPEERLNKIVEKTFFDELREELKAIGRNEMMATLQKMTLEEQNERHQRGSKWIGAGGTSTFGATGENPARTTRAGDAAR